jgi:hypothetical protein
MMKAALLLIVAFSPAWVPALAFVIEYYLPGTIYRKGRN